MTCEPNWLSYIENDIESNSIKHVFSQFISTIMEKLHAKIEDKLLNKFWMNGQFVSTSQKRGKFVISDIRWPLQRFNQIQLWQLIGTIIAIGKVHAKNREKVYISF